MRVVILAQGETDEALARALGVAGHDVHLLRLIPNDVRPPPRRSGGVTTTAVGEYPPMIPADHALSRTLQTNLGMLDRAAAVLAGATWDVIHAGGPGLVYAATGLSRMFDVPLVATIRDVRAFDTTTRQMTWWLAVESTRVVVRSRRIAGAIAGAFGISERKIAVVGSSRAADPDARARSLADRSTRVYQAALAEHGARRRPPPAQDARMLRQVFERDALRTPVAR